MNKSVYVLGAGFCRDFSEISLPLVFDFLSMAKAMNIYQPDSAHRGLATFIHRYFGDETFPDIEKVLSFLSATPFDELGVSFEKRAYLYDELVGIIVRLLTAASAVVANMSSGDRAVWRLYYKFIEHVVETQSTIITFNYDLLLEELLRSTNKWQMYDGYGVHIPLIYDSLPTPSFGNTRADDYIPRDSRSKVILLKLHGSINWGIPINQAVHQMDKGDVIYRLPERGGSLSIDYHRLPAGEGVPLTLVFKPVIVPPVLDKSSWLMNRTFRFIWNMAMEAVKAAREITFIGFSLPPTDFMAEFMFRQGSLDRATKSVTVVAPNASDMRLRYEQLFGSSVTFIDKGFHGWCIDKFY